MKIQNILTERFDADDTDYDPPDLKKGYYRDDLHAEDESVTVGNMVIKFKIYQETIRSPTRYSRESPPEDESYIGDVEKIEIDEIRVPSQSFDLPDLEYEMDYPINPKQVQAFYKFIQSFVGDFEGEELEQYNKAIAYPFHNNPDLLKQIFDSIENVADNVYKGEI